MTVFSARLGAVAAQGITTVYLAGPMSGIADHNFPAFNQWAVDLMPYFEVTNPADADDLNADGSAKFSWEHFLTRDVRHVLDVDAVMALPAWQTSRGATFELLIAMILGKRCFDLASAEEANVAFELSPADVFKAFGDRWGNLTGLRYRPKIDAGGMPPLLAETIEEKFAAKESIDKAERLLTKILGGFEENTKPPIGPPPSWALGSLPGEEPEAPAPNILEEANKIIHGDRAADYGHPLDNHGRTAAFWATYLGIEITAEQVCFLNVLQKISRGMNSVTRDTLVDIAGYAGNAEMIQTERFKRVSP